MRRWDVLERLVKDNDYETFLELGSKEGRTTSHILEKCELVSVIAIDPLAIQPSQADKAGGETYEGWDFAAIEAEFWERTDPWKDRLTFHRKFGDDVGRNLDDASQDLIFIDAAHDYDSVVHDIQTWLPKVRSGGILAGHDYQHKFPSVMRAVADCFNLMDVHMEDDSVWWVKQ